MHYVASGAQLRKDGRTFLDRIRIQTHRERLQGQSDPDFPNHSFCFADARP